MPTEKKLLSPIVYASGFIALLVFVSCVLVGLPLWASLLIALVTLSALAAFLYTNNASILPQVAGALMWAYPIASILGGAAIYHAIDQSAELASANSDLEIQKGHSEKVTQGNKKLDEAVGLLRSQVESESAKRKEIETLLASNKKELAEANKAIQSSSSLAKEKKDELEKRLMSQIEKNEKLAAVLKEVADEKDELFQRVDELVDGATAEEDGIIETEIDDAGNEELKVTRKIRKNGVPEWLIPITWPLALLDGDIFGTKTIYQERFVKLSERIRSGHLREAELENALSGLSPRQKKLALDAWLKVAQEHGAANKDTIIKLLNDKLVTVNTEYRNTLSDRVGAVFDALIKDGSGSAILVPEKYKELLSPHFLDAGEKGKVKEVIRIVYDPKLEKALWSELKELRTAE